MEYVNIAIASMAIVVFREHFKHEMVKQALQISSKSTAIFATTISCLQIM
jgi:hypothetical protein